MKRYSPGKVRGPAAATVIALAERMADHVISTGAKVVSVFPVLASGMGNAGDTRRYLAAKILGADPCMGNYYRKKMPTLDQYRVELEARLQVQRGIVFVEVDPQEWAL